MVKQLIYKSQSTTKISTELVDNVLLHARRFNADRGITGILLFSEDIFLQFLEGAPEDIDLVYQRICHDPRHTNIVTLYTGYADTRAYPNWKMMTYSTHQMRTYGQSDAYILATNLMENAIDDRAMDIGAFMKSFCDDFLPIQKPERSSYN